MSKKKEPIHKVTTYWPIQAAIWENFNAEGQPYHQFTLQRSYIKTDKETNDKKYHSTESFNANDAMALELTIDEAWKWINTEGRQRSREHNLAPAKQAKEVVAA